MDFSSDLRWLLDLCRHDLGGGYQSFERAVDVDKFVALAESHRLTVIAERSWRALAAKSLAPAPPAALAKLAVKRRHGAFFAAGHLSRLAHAFEAAKVNWVSLKGPALSIQLYSDATVRIARDLDVIVPSDQLHAAIAVTGSLGWVAPLHWDKLMRITGRYDMELRPTEPKQPLLELHSSLGPPYAQFDLDPFAAEAQTTIRVGTADIPTFNGPTQATYVAWHGARGLWYRLAWLVDCARLLPRNDDAEAHRLLMTARACKAECAVRAGALLAQRLFGITPPRFPEAPPSVTRRVDRMIGWALERLHLGVDAPSAWSPPGSYLWLWREIAQQDNVGRSLGAALDHLTRPTAQDAEQFGLDRPLMAHRLARPVLLAGRLFRPSRDSNRPAA